MPIMARQPNGEYIEICVIPSWIGGTQHDISEIKLPTDERIFKNWRTYEGTLPVTVTHSKSGFAISYKIWGNTGGVGVKKVNLAEDEQLLRTTSMTQTGEIVATSANYAFRLIPVVKNKEYSIVNIYGAEASEFSNFYAFFEELPQIGSISYNERRYSFKTPSRTFVAPITGFVAVSDYYPMYEEQHSNLIPLEVYEGNASPYYMPIVSSSETTNVYIGRTALDKDEYVDGGEQKIYKWGAIAGLSEPLCGIDTYTDSLDLSTGVVTRRIKKLELTGEEDLIFAGKDANRTVCSISLMDGGYSRILCTHILSKSSYQPTEYDRVLYYPLVTNKPLYISLSNKYLEDQTATSFKSYFAAQYAAGTPVTIWYVLAEPEVSTIPVPSGLTGTIEGYLVQDGTPTPENPIYPTANGTKQTDGTYSIESAYLTPTDPPEPLPPIPTFAGATTVSYGGTGAQPEKVEFTYKLGV